MNQKSFIGRVEEVGRELAEQKKYILSAGRRQPLHLAHQDCLEEIIQTGLTPIMLVGSVNKPDSFLYDPIKNPLNYEQRKNFIQMLMGDLDVQDFHIFPIEDNLLDSEWARSIKELLVKNNIDPELTAIHFRSKKSDVFDKYNEQVLPLSYTVKTLNENGLSAWQSFPLNEDLLQISASKIRNSDLNSASNEEVVLYLEELVGLAEAARNKNPFSDRLSKIPITTLDLTLDRLSKETSVDLESLLSRKKGFNEISDLTKRVSRWRIYDHDRVDGIKTELSKQPKIKAIISKNGEAVFSAKKSTNIPLKKTILELDKILSDPISFKVREVEGNRVLVSYDNPKELAKALEAVGIKSTINIDNKIRKVEKKLNNLQKTRDRSVGPRYGDVSTWGKRVAENKNRPNYLKKEQISQIVEEIKESLLSSDSEVAFVGYKVLLTQQNIADQDLKKSLIKDGIFYLAKRNGINLMEQAQYQEAGSREIITKDRFDARFHPLKSQMDQGNLDNFISDVNKVFGKENVEFDKGTSYSRGVVTIFMSPEEAFRCAQNNLIEENSLTTLVTKAIYSEELSAIRSPENPTARVPYF